MGKRSSEGNAKPGSHDGWRRQLTFEVLERTFAVCKLVQDAAIPAWAGAGEFMSITRTADELSMMCCQDDVPPGIACERGWRCLRVAGTMPFSLVGVLASLTVPLAEAGISVFAISTFDTDYLLVKEINLIAALKVLRSHGHRLS
jgi:hypothetical protein